MAAQGILSIGDMAAGELTKYVAAKMGDEFLVHGKLPGKTWAAYLAAVPRADLMKRTSGTQAVTEKLRLALRLAMGASLAHPFFADEGFLVKNPERPHLKIESPYFCRIVTEAFKCSTDELWDFDKFLCEPPGNVLDQKGKPYDYRPDNLLLATFLGLWDVADIDPKTAADQIYDLVLPPPVAG
jgi:hypothetical protein